MAGKPHPDGLVARTGLEPGPDGRDHLVARAMNWRAEPKGPVVSVDDLAQRILHGLAQPGVHRALFDLNNWTLLKWLDEPCSFYDWRGGETEQPRVHPDDEPMMASMTTEFADGATSRVLRMRGPRRRLGAGACHRQPGGTRTGRTFAGLVSLRLPTDSELADAGLPKATDRLGGRPVPPARRPAPPR